MNGLSNYGVTNATDLGGSCANAMQPATATPAWFLPVTVWHPRSGK